MSSTILKYIITIVASILCLLLSTTYLHIVIHQPIPLDHDDNYTLETIRLTLAAIAQWLLHLFHMISVPTKALKKDQKGRQVEIMPHYVQFEVVREQETAVHRQ